MALLRHLVRSEFIRLAKYNLFGASFAVALIWIAVTAFLDLNELLMFLPLVFLMESSLMTALLVGAEMFYEKKEHTISSMLISPMTTQVYLASKILAHTLNSYVIFTLIALALVFFHTQWLLMHWLYLAVLLISALYVLVGLILSYYSKDFTALLMNYALFTISLVFPSVMVLLGWAPNWLESLLFYSPIEVTLRLMQPAIEGLNNWGQWWIDVLYTSVLTFGLYAWVVKPNFKAYATRDLGV
jgi:fluoroquinolone transport system permease protein